MEPKKDFEYDEYDEHAEIRIRRDDRDLPGVVRRALTLTAFHWAKDPSKKPDDVRFILDLSRGLALGDEPSLAPDELFAEEVDS